MSENFSERTDELSRKLRCTMRDLAGKIGISQAMLFAYRSGKSEPTLKALRKLEAAENEAGIVPDGSPIAKSEGNPKEFSEGEGRNHGVELRLAAVESRLASLEGTLAALVGALQLAAGLNSADGAKAAAAAARALGQGNGLKTA